MEDTVETAAAPAGASSTTTPAAVTGVDTFAAAAGSSSSSIGHPVELAEPHGMGRPAGAAGSSTSSSKQQGSQERVDPWGVYLVGLQPDIASQQLHEIFSAYGKVKNVAIITVKYHTTKCAFVNFLTAAAASKVWGYLCST
jgi:RNA recognition motif-containing protein